MSQQLRVLGIDPGLTRCGIGVVQGPPARPRMVATELVSTAADTPIEQRLLAIHKGVADAIAAHRPDLVACERVLFSRNVRTAMATGQAAGVALLAAAEAGLDVTSYSPTDIKLAVAGHGGADKDAVGRMVAAQLGLTSVPEPPDVADALAVAITHLTRARLAHAGQAAARRGGSVATAGPPGAGTSGATSWEDVLNRPHVRVAGGTGPEGARTSADRSIHRGGTSS